MKRLLLLGMLMQWAGAGYCAGTTAANFLSVGVGARNIAMGETGATDTSVTAAYWNPAGLAVLPAAEAGFMHARWFEDVTLSYLAYARPLSFGTLGFSADYLSMDSIDKIDNTGTPVGQSFKPSDMALTVSYARVLGRVPCGVSFKYISSTIDDASATAVAADAGVLLDPFLPPSLSAGVSVRNAGTGMTFVNDAFALPFNVRLGLSWRAAPRLTVAADANVPAEAATTGHLGAEYRLPAGKNITIAPRAGYRTGLTSMGGLAGLTAGIGVAVNAVSFDYAMVSYGDIDAAHRISLSYRFASRDAHKSPLDGGRNPAHMAPDNGPVE